MSKTAVAWKPSTKAIGDQPGLFSGTERQEDRATTAFIGLDASGSPYLCILCILQNEQAVSQVQGSESPISLLLPELVSDPEPPNLDRTGKRKRH